MTEPAPFDLGDALAYLEPLLPDEWRNEDLPHLAPPGTHCAPSLDPAAVGLLDVLVRARRPARILEVGTCLGRTALILGRAAAGYGGQVVTLEVDERLAELARANVNDARLTETVEVVCADAHEWIGAATGTFGLILQDADKEAYEPMLDALVAHLEPGGLLLSDDILFPVMDLPESAQRWKAALDSYNRALRDHPALRTTWLPIGDGMALSVKVAG